MFGHRGADGAEQEAFKSAVAAAAQDEQLRTTAFLHEHLGGGSLPDHHFNIDGGLEPRASVTVCAQTFRASSSGSQTIGSKVPKAMWNCQAATATILAESKGARADAQRKARMDEGLPSTPTTIAALGWPSGGFIMPRLHTFAAWAQTGRKKHQVASITSISFWSWATSDSSEEGVDLMCGSVDGDLVLGVSHPVPLG